GPVAVEKVPLRRDLAAEALATERTGAIIDLAASRETVALSRVVHVNDGGGVTADDTLARGDRSVLLEPGQFAGVIVRSEGESPVEGIESQGALRVPRGEVKGPLVPAAGADDASRNLGTGSGGVRGSGDQSGEFRGWG